MKNNVIEEAYDEISNLPPKEARVFLWMYFRTLIFGGCAMLAILIFPWKILGAAEKPKVDVPKQPVVSEKYEVDIRTGFLRDKDGNLLSPKWLITNCGAADQIKALKERAKKGDEAAIILLLSAAWHVLPLSEANAVIEIAHSALSRQVKNSVIYYYLGLFHETGVGIRQDQDLSLNLFWKAYLGGCQRSGLEFFDLLTLRSGANFEVLMKDWRARWKGAPTDPDFLSRLAWMEICGFGIKKTEESGWKKIAVTASQGSKFGNLQMGWQALKNNNPQQALPFLKEALSHDHHFESYLYLASALLTVKDTALEDVELLYYEAARKLHWGALSELAEILEKRCEYEESVKLYLFAMGSLHREIGDEEEMTDKVEKRKNVTGAVESDGYYLNKKELFSRVKELGEKIQHLVQQKKALRGKIENAPEVIKEFVQKKYYLNARLEQLRSQKLLKNPEL
jgi:hypothetical protein